MDDRVVASASHNLFHGGSIANISLDDLDFSIEFLDVGPFDLRVLKVIEVIENRDPIAGLQQASDNMRADEPRATGD